MSAKQRFTGPLDPRTRGRLVRKFMEFTGKSRAVALAELTALGDDEWAWRQHIVRELRAGAHPDCPQCQRRDPGTPNHDGSPYCRSGSIASGDARQVAHCTCDTCY